MAIQNLFTSRDNTLDGNTYVGQLGRLWYNPDTNSLYASDGETVGGIPVDLATGANILANNIVANDIAVNTITSRTNLISIDGSLDVTGNVIFTGNISPATNTKIGGIKAGPGANIANDGTLTIDTSGLPLSFGDFTANVNLLTLVNEDENMILATKGSAEVQLVGNIGFYRTNGFPPDVANKYFSASDDGQIQILVSNVDPSSGAVEIIGSSSGDSFSPLNSGVMLHITGQNGDASRFYNDGIGSFASFVGRRYNGNVASPTAVQAGEEIIRISSTGYNGTEIPGGAGARIVFQAIENYTPSNNGTNLSFWTCAVGSNSLTKIATIDSANGVSATQFTTEGNVSAGNVIASLVSSTTVAATGNVSGGNVTTQGQVTAIGNITGNYLFGNAAFTTGINAYGNVFANGVSVLAITGSSSLTITPGNNTVITGDNGLKSVTIGVSQSPSFTGNVSAIGFNTTGNVTADGSVTSNSKTAGVGYRAGAGGTVTQLTSKSTAVTLNAVTGEITMSNEQLGGDSTVSFTLNNSAIANTDLLVLNQVSDANIGFYSFNGKCNSGNAVISVHNMTNTNRSDAIVIRFAVIKGAVA